MLSTSVLRSVWGPPCRGPWITKDLYGRGTVTVRAAIWEAVDALNICLVVWKYATREADTGAYVCRLITGGRTYSLHAYGIAIDINWQSNPYGRRLISDMPRGMVNAIKSIRTKNGAQVWGWGGDYSGNKDAMHFEIVCTPADLATGINWATLPNNTPAPPPAPGPTPAPSPINFRIEDDMYVQNKKDGAIWAISATHCHHLSPSEWNSRVAVESAVAMPIEELHLVALTIGAGRIKV